MALKLTCLSGNVLLLIACGYLLPSLQKPGWARGIAWILALVTLAFSVLATTGQSPAVRMGIIAFLQLLAMKVLVNVETYQNGIKLKVLQWVSFSTLWFGMRPRLFEKLVSPPLPFSKIALNGLLRIAIGFMLLKGSAILDAFPAASTFFIPQLLMLAGFSFVLHFGILNLSTAGWRGLGVDVTALFRSPYKSKSLKEFWGKRWNLAFSEMTALIAYRPLTKIMTKERALTLSFLFSGLLHEMAISVPVNAGYGLPMTYFAIHAAAMQLESRSSIVRHFIQNKVLSHVWVMTLLVAPLPLLFHHEFIHRVLIPLRDLI